MHISCSTFSLYHCTSQDRGIMVNLEFYAYRGFLHILPIFPCSDCKSSSLDCAVEGFLFRKFFPDDQFILRHSKCYEPLRSSKLNHSENASTHEECNREKTWHCACHRIQPFMKSHSLRPFRDQRPTSRLLAFWAFEPTHHRMKE